MAASRDRASTRHAGRAARHAIGGPTRARAEASLVHHLLSLSAITEAASVGVFHPDDGEPDLRELVDDLWARNVTVALPVVEDDPADFSMRFVPWYANDVLRPARFGIPVPPSRCELEPATLLVSFTGFDAAGNRIGRGGGFFDRYLTSTRAHVIGVGFEAQRFDAVPVDAHDVALPVIVTDLGVRFPGRTLP